jgi:hypothetical protein
MVCFNFRLATMEYYFDLLEYLVQYVGKPLTQVLWLGEEELVAGSFEVFDNEWFNRIGMN